MVTKRQVGVAVGSLVVAWLVVGLAGGFVLSWLGFTPTATPTIPGPGAPAVLSLAGIVFTVVLGRLIYRFAVRNDR